MSIFATTEARAIRADGAKMGLGNSFSHRLSNEIHGLNLGLIGSQKISATRAFNRHVDVIGMLTKHKVLNITYTCRQPSHLSVNLKLLTGTGTKFQRNVFKNVITIQN